MLVGVNVILTHEKHVRLNLINRSIRLLWDEFNLRNLQKYTGCTRSFAKVFRASETLEMKSAQTGEIEVVFAWCIVSIALMEAIYIYNC
jgi:hypothetical protein